MQDEDWTGKLTDRRRELLANVARQRTRHFTIVLEDFFDPHNISAVIRTCEVYGIQDVHIIEEDNPWRVNKSVLKGSFKWLDIWVYRKRQSCLQELRKRGYRIAVASTNTDASVRDLDLSQPTAFYLGAEFRGNHPETLKAADCHFKLPQYGITESMNVSVAGGVLLTYLDVFLQSQGRETFTLNATDQHALLEEWAERHTLGVERRSPVHRLD